MTFYSFLFFYSLLGLKFGIYIRYIFFFIINLKHFVKYYVFNKLSFFSLYNKWIYAIDRTNLSIDVIKLQKMAFLFNALENGWSIKKKNKLYIFSKNHEGKKEVYLDSYLKRFMVENFDFNKFLS